MKFTNDDYTAPLHPVGDYRATVKLCTGKNGDDGGKELHVVVATHLGEVSQYWRASNMGWKIKLFADSLGCGEDGLDTDAAVGQRMDIRITHTRSEKTGKEYENIETHAEGALLPLEKAQEGQSSSPAPAGIQTPDGMPGF
jgi:hypothetical protein